MPKAKVRIGDTKQYRPIRIKYKVGGRKSNVGCGSMTDKDLKATIEKGGKDKAKVFAFLSAKGRTL